jgi:hypothetical protein
MGHIKNINQEELQRRAKRAESYGPENLRGQPLSDQTRNNFWETIESQNPQAVITAWLNHVYPSNGSRD